MSEHTNGPDPATYRVEEARKAYERAHVLCRVKGKAPQDKGWQKQKPPSLEIVEAWARLGSLGLRTGAVSGVIVIDDDTDEHNAAEALNLPPTPTMITGGGGRHHYFRHPGGTIKNSASKLAPGVDVRGDNGVVVYAGAIHPETGQMYRWAEGLSPDDIAFAELPDHVLEKLRPTKAPKPKAEPGAAKANTRKRRYAQGALRRSIHRIQAAAEGTRNDTVNRAAYDLGRFVGAGWLNIEDVRDSLLSAAISAGLSESEAAPTIESGLKAGQVSPVNDSILAEPRETDPASDHGRSTIVILAGQLPRVVSAAESALLARNPHALFIRGDVPVRLVRSAAVRKKAGIKAPAGAVSLVTVEAAFLVEMFMHAARFQRLDELGVMKECDCPDKLAKHYLARRGHWRALHLEQVIEVPIMREDGTLLIHEGYDPGTRLYLDSGGLVLPGIPDRPTLDDARAALETLITPIREFPFVERSDRAVALAAILTVLVRPWLHSAPMFAFRAPKMSSGKSLLADVVAMVATGRAAPVMTPGNDDEEIRKRLTAFLLAGFPIACIDNVERPFGSDAMCSVLTQLVWRDRILGRSEMVTLPTAVVWTITGNNLQLVGDITTRVLPCDIDAGVERPGERKFSLNLYEYVPEHRATLVAAGLTILRAYHLAGRPSQGLSRFGRFEEWSDVVRSALVWCGEADACAGMQRLEAVDPVRSQLRELLEVWHATLGEQPVTVSDLLARATSGQPEMNALGQALMDVAADAHGKPNSRKLGRWLAKVERRTEGGLRCLRMGERQGVALWAVRRGEQPSVGLVGFEGYSTSTQSAGESQRDDEAESPHTDVEKSPDSESRPENPPNPRNPRRPAGLGYDDDDGPGCSAAGGA